MTTVTWLEAAYHAIHRVTEGVTRRAKRASYWAYFRARAVEEQARPAMRSGMHFTAGRYSTLAGILLTDMRGRATWFNSWSAFSSSPSDLDKSCTIAD